MLKSKQLQHFNSLRESLLRETALRRRPTRFKGKGKRREKGKGKGGSIRRPHRRSPKAVGPLPACPSLVLSPGRAPRQDSPLLADQQREAVFSNFCEFINELRILTVSNKHNNSQKAQQSTTTKPRSFSAQGCDVISQAPGERGRLGLRTS